MSDLYSFGLAEIIAGLIIVVLCAYAITGGADFGGGVWDLLASGPRREEQREIISRSLAPIWEANHVWLIIVVVMLFTGFPSAFAAITTYLHIPLTVMLVGIVARGSAFVFRSYGARDERHRHRWGLVFAIASTITPIFLGVCIGALASGRVGAAMPMDPSDSFVTAFVMTWFTWFAFAVGFFALALFAFLAAVYLAYGSSGALQEDFRRRALGAAGVVFIMAAIALAASHVDAMRIATAIIRTPIGIVVQVVTGLFAITAIGALWKRRYSLARVAAAAQTVSILWGWALAQFPWIIPEKLRIKDAAAPRETQVLLLVGLMVGGALLIPALRYLFRLFTRQTAATSSG
jgi:cytochrome bd ubiquinol oxidase subunit II